MYSAFTGIPSGVSQVRSSVDETLASLTASFSQSDGAGEGNSFSTALSLGAVGVNPKADRFQALQGLGKGLGAFGLNRAIR